MMFDVGEIVVSRAGRDIGECYVVMGIIDDNYVYLVNGKTKSFQNPKKKKIRHIMSVNEKSEEFKVNMENKALIQDAEVRKILKNF